MSQDNWIGCSALLGIIVIWIFGSMYIISDITDDDDEYAVLYKNTVSSAVFITVDSDGGSWTGSGVFISRDMILTAGHVLGALNSYCVVEPDMVTVQLHNGVTLEVIDVYAEDYRYADIGILRVKWPEGVTTPLYIPSFAKSLVVGEKIYAIGAPFAIYPTLTHGIVSQVNVDFMETASLLLQTDCALNPGNSGGPLFNLQGELVGICVASEGTARQSSGVNFGETVVTAQLVIDKYKAIRAVKRLDPCVYAVPPVMIKEVIGTPQIVEPILELENTVVEMQDSIAELRNAVSRLCDVVAGLLDRIDELSVTDTVSETPENFVTEGQK